MRASRVPSPPWMTIFLAFDTSSTALLKRVLGRARDRPVGEDRVPQHRLVDLLRGDVAGQDHHPDAALQDRCLQGELGDARHLAGRG